MARSKLRAPQEQDHGAIQGASDVANLVQGRKQPRARSTLKDELVITYTSVSGDPPSADMGSVVGTVKGAASTLSRVSTPMTGNREFRDDIVRLASLTVREPRLDGYIFVNCQIVGPAVLAIGDNVQLNHCTFEADINAVFWEVDPRSRPMVFGAVGLSNVTFAACSFQAVGFAGPATLRRAFEDAIN